MDTDPNSLFGQASSFQSPWEKDEKSELKSGLVSSSSVVKRRKRSGVKVLQVEPEHFRQMVEKLTGLGQGADRDPFICHCSLFPSDYEFTKQELVSLWVAQGLFEGSTEQQKEREDKMFDSLVSDEVIVPSRYDPYVDFSHQTTRTLLYKLIRSKVILSMLEYALVLDGNLDDVPDIVKHLTINSKGIGHAGFESLERFQDLQTLFVLPAHGFYVEQVPRGLFLSLKHLRSLTLSRSLITELPSSIGNLKSLRYLDLSYAPIKRLPESIVSLCNLQTLRLRGCTELVGLPKGTAKLTNLKHLDLDIIGQLKSMPPAMGNLTNLQTLSAFLVGKEDGSRIIELKNMVNLRGAICISRIENVSGFEEAMEADLINKKFLSKLQLRWTESGEDDASKQEQIIQALQPPLGLEELTLINYGGLKLPSWVANASYDHLVGMTLYNCLNCDCLLPIGKLPSLQALHIREMHKLESIDEQFCRDGEGQQSHAFTSLTELTIQIMPALKEWTGVKNGDFPCLLKLKVEHCPELVSLPLLSCLDSLEYLEMNYCPNISSLPDGGVATSVEYLLIKDCFELTKTCNKMEGKDWGKISHIPNIFIDDEKISCQ